jgi:cysteine desulfurase family protein
MGEAPRRLFFDNAATSSPKPPAVIEAMVDYATRLGGSPGRGAYFEAQETGRLIDRCRARIGKLINAEGDPEQIIFTLNCSDALNLAIKGVVAGRLAREPERSVHIITSAFDHNSVLRPLNELVARYPDLVAQTRIPVDPRTGLLSADEIARALDSHDNTALVAINHASNVTGVIQDIAPIGALCRARGVPFLLDAAQSLGHIPVDVRALGADLLAFPGHKGLLGPSGTGGLYIRPGFEARLLTLREGGTGSRSEQDSQPSVLPDKYEPGSPNAIGILGLSEGVNFILNFKHGAHTGADAIAAHESDLMAAFLGALGFDPGGAESASLSTHSPSHPSLTVHGPTTARGRVGVFSVSIDGLTPQELAAVLESHFGILTRAGVHCAPLAHQTLETTGRGGATRLSFGPFLTEADVRHAAAALVEIASESPARV